MNDEVTDHLLKEIYQRLMTAYGPQQWWPAPSPFEVMVGAVLTQSTAWINVEKAIDNLKAAQVLSPESIRNVSFSDLAQIIKPSGYYNVKARKLKSLAYWLGATFADNIDKMAECDTKSLREQFLSVYGIGPETADSILLYVVKKPIFVIDTYTRRIISRIGLMLKDNSYDDYQRLFMVHLKADVVIYNEYHALLVKLAKEACNKKPLCRKCCLNDICRFYKELFII
ncbi:MAG: endonuclease [Dehalococcoidales bacterium]|nr:endonuclease [Dehalococcoidales bacterium]